MSYRNPSSLIRIFAAARPQRAAAAMVTVYLLSMIFLLMTLSLSNLSLYQSKDRNRYELYKDEFAAAEEAINKAFAHVQFLVQSSTPNLPTMISATPQPVVAGFDVLNFNVNQVSAGMQAVNSGQWQGLSLYRLIYDASVRVRETGSNSSQAHPGVALSQRFEITYIPLFNFAIFYDPTLEIAPGPSMSINGRVHANGDAYLQANTGLDFLEHVTVAGSIFHGRHPDSGKSESSGPVRFVSDSGGTMRSMSVSGDENGDGWLDSEDSNWTAEASGRYGEYVRDSAHGVNPLGLPIPPVADPHAIIERSLPTDDPSYNYAVEEAKFENMAGFRIAVNSGGVAVGERINADGTTTEVPLQYYINDSGNAVAVTDASPNPDPTTHPTKNIVETSSFHDHREDATVNALDVNIGNMLEYTDSWPDNGILYVSNEDSGGNPGVVRLKNATELPVASGTTGFTVATDDPIYVQGDYNTVNKTLSMVAADAVYVLSNSWDDSREQNDDTSLNNASETTQNVVYINGIVPSQDNNYSGGVENYFRFLESWAGRDYNFSGSIIQLWESQKALGPWVYGNGVYTAPNRPWSWDTALGGIDGPPGAPRVVEMIRSQWSVTQ